MEELVAVAVELASGDVRYFITWGRIQHPVDPRPLARLILDQCHHFALGSGVRTVRICPTLQEAAQQPFFYDALFTFAQHPIPFGSGYDAWRAAIDLRMQAGKEFYFLGTPQSGSRSRTKPHAARQPDALNPCCAAMAVALTHRCPDHATVFECPDALIYYAAPAGAYGMLIHDGGTAYRTITFCPWCGAKLPSAKRVR